MPAEAAAPLSIVHQYRSRSCILFFVANLRHAADGPASLTGAHHRLLTDYVVLELVAHAASWADMQGTETYEMEVALEREVGFV